MKFSVAVLSRVVYSQYSNGPYGDWEVNNQFVGVRRCDGEDYDFDGEAFAVVAIYSTGDTFGRESGATQLLDVFDNFEDALALSSEAKCWNARFLDTSGSVYKWEYEVNGRTYRPNWLGYFEHLDQIAIETC